MPVSVFHLGAHVQWEDYWKGYIVDQLDGNLWEVFIPVEDQLRSIEGNEGSSMWILEKYKKVEEGYFEKNEHKVFFESRYFDEKFLFSKRKVFSKGMEVEAKGLFLWTKYNGLKGKIVDVTMEDDWKTLFDVWKVKVKMHTDSAVLELDTKNLVWVEVDELEKQVLFTKKLRKVPVSLQAESLKDLEMEAIDVSPLDSLNRSKMWTSAFFSDRDYNIFFRKFDFKYPENGEITGDII